MDEHHFSSKQQHLQSSIAGEGVKLLRTDKEQESDRVSLQLPSSRPRAASFPRGLVAGCGWVLAGTGGSSRCRCRCCSAVTVRVQLGPARHQNNNHKKGKKKLEEILKAFLFFHPPNLLLLLSPTCPHPPPPAILLAPPPSPETQITSA